MYLPAHFTETRPEQLHRIIREHPFGMLVTHSAGGRTPATFPSSSIPTEARPVRCRPTSRVPIPCGRKFRTMPT